MKCPVMNTIILQLYTRRKVVTYDTNSPDQIMHISMSCNHCGNPVCVYICPENNYEKRQDGIVIHHAKNCRSCMRCINACPFEAPKINPKTKRADKCDFCYERIDQGLKPVCVENCITGALSILKGYPNNEIMATNKKEQVPIAQYTNPSVFIIEKRKRHVYLREGKRIK